MSQMRLGVRPWRERGIKGVRVPSRVKRDGVEDFAEASDIEPLDPTQTYCATILTVRTPT